jgi:hypothetical protein
MRWKRRPRDKAEAREWLRQFVSNLRAMGQAGRNRLDVDRANRFADAGDAYLEGRVPSMDVALDLQRPEAEAREWLKQFAGNLRELRGIQKEHLKALGPMIKTAGHASPVWIDPEIIPLPGLADWMIDAIDAYTLENPTTRNRRARGRWMLHWVETACGATKGHAEG